jgi:hypothetical protein
VQLPYALDDLVGAGAAAAEVGADGGELVRLPAHADTEDEPVAGQAGQGGGLLGQQHRFAQRRDQHRGAQPDAAGVRGQVREGDQRLVHAAVGVAVGLRRQQVVGQPQGAVAEILRLSGQLHESRRRHGG